MDLPRYATGLMETIAAYRRVALILLFFGVQDSATAQYQFQNPTLTNISYGPLTAQRADLFVPRTAGGPRPAVILIHGGGWVGGSRQGAYAAAQPIVSANLICFDIDYRLADKDKPETWWPAQLEDVQLAVRWLRAHSAELGVDPERIGAMGDSAGGQLAVFLGVLPKVVPGDMAALLPNVQPDVRAVVDEFGALDLMGMGKYAVASIEALFGTKGRDKGMLSSTSPLPAITDRAAPTLIVHGERDIVVPISVSVTLLHQLQKHGVSADFVTFGGGHGYEGLAWRDVNALLRMEAAWLNAQLYR